MKGSQRNRLVVRGELWRCERIAAHALERGLHLGSKRTNWIRLDGKNVKSRSLPESGSRTLGPPPRWPQSFGHQGNPIAMDMGLCNCGFVNLKLAELSATGIGTSGIPQGILWLAHKWPARSPGPDHVVAGLHTALGAPTVLFRGVPVLLHRVKPEAEGSLWPDVSLFWIIPVPETR